ncbi:gamma-gliadin-like [Helianthus annuus]|uniref:gamma-gliadin-like n=1 Tax=Helianthus annuus TaxID=4232 RepID=UPI0016532AA8|nr:gamma-gliadin-like [Helianthus annuus]
MQGQMQVIPNVGGVQQQQLIPQHVRPRPHGPQMQRPIPLQQVRPPNVQQQFQRPLQNPPMPQQQLQQPNVPQGHIPRPMGVRPRDEFYTAQKTNDARKGLRSFQQQQGEMFHEAFGRLNMMIKNCPHHGIELWELMNAFHEGLCAEHARDLMSITNGTFGTNYENDD